MKIELNVFDLYALLEVSWNKPTSTYQSIMDRMANQWYEMMNESVK